MLLPSIAKEAQKLGFTAASSKGVDDPYFQNFRDLGKVIKLKDGNSSLFCFFTCLVMFW